MPNLNLYEYSVQLIGPVPPYLEFIYGLAAFALFCGVVGSVYAIIKLCSRFGGFR